MPRLFSRSFESIATGNELLVCPERSRLPEHVVDQRCLAVINVGDNGNVAYVFPSLHTTPLNSGCRAVKKIASSRCRLLKANPSIRRKSGANIAKGEEKSKAPNHVVHINNILR